MRKTLCDAYRCDDGTSVVFTFNAQSYIFYIDLKLNVILFFKFSDKE